MNRASILKNFLDTLKTYLYIFICLLFMLQVLFLLDLKIMLLVLLNCILIYFCFFLYINVINIFTLKISNLSFELCRYYYFILNLLNNIILYNFLMYIVRFLIRDFILFYYFFLRIYIIKLLYFRNIETNWNLISNLSLLS